MPSNYFFLSFQYDKHEGKIDFFLRSSVQMHWRKFVNDSNEREFRSASTCMISGVVFGPGQGHCLWVCCFVVTRYSPSSPQSRQVIRRHWSISMPLQPQLLHGHSRRRKWSWFRCFSHKQLRSCRVSRSQWSTQQRHSLPTHQTRFWLVCRFSGPKTLTLVWIELTDVD